MSFECNERRSASADGIEDGHQLRHIRPILTFLAEYTPATATDCHTSHQHDDGRGLRGTLPRTGE
jgi:hypothetical protein